MSCLTKNTTAAAAAAAEIAAVTAATVGSTISTWHRHFFQVVSSWSSRHQTYRHHSRLKKLSVRSHCQLVMRQNPHPLQVITQPGSGHQAAVL
jgi:hypothetical protein